MKSPERGSRFCAADTEVLGGWGGVGRGAVSTGYESLLSKKVGNTTGLPEPPSYRAVKSLEIVEAYFKRLRPGGGGSCL